MYLKDLLSLLKHTFIPIEKKFELLSDYSDIEEKLLKTKKKKKKKQDPKKWTRKLEFLCHNKKHIHSILFENEQYIFIPSKAPETLPVLFYIITLINDQKSIINYIVDYSYIENINNYRRHSGIIVNFLLSMIILQLIDNYNNDEDFRQKENDERIRIIHEENMEIKKNKNSMNIIKEYNLKKCDVESNNVEEIYAQIIISLIKEERLKEYEKISILLLELGLDSINITEKIFNELLILFNSNEEYIRKYMITKFDDLFNNDKINFYYILLTFIFKSYLYIYNVPFLLKTKNVISNIIKNNFGKFLEMKNNKKNEKIEFIIKAFCGYSYQYYYKKYLILKKEEFQQILKYYKIFLFESKQKDIVLLEHFLNNSKIETNYEKYLEDYNIAKNLNEREAIIMIFIEEREREKTEENIQKYIKKWSEIEKAINNKKYKKMRCDDKQILKEYFCNNVNKEILLKIFKEDIYNSFMDEIKNEEQNIENMKKDNNNKENEVNAMNKDFYNDDTIIKKEVQEISTVATKDNKIKKAVLDESINDCNNNNEQENEEKSQEYNTEKQKDDEYKYYDNSELIENCEKIGKHANMAESIQEVGQGYFVSKGLDNLLLYNQDYEKILSLDNKDIISGITESKTVKKNNIKLLASNHKELLYIDIDLERNEYKRRSSGISIPSSFCLEINKKGHYVCGPNGAYCVSDLFSKIITPYCNIISNGLYVNGICIDKNIIAFTSNEIIKNGKNKIDFYNISSKRLFKEFNGYSFIKSKTGLTLIPSNKESSNDKILLCACKKYKRNQKNGILLLNIKMNKDNMITDINDIFYDTKNFEVFCFCQLGFKSKQNIERILDIEYEDNLSYTDYVLVGGYDQNKGKGIIKLYKLVRRRKKTTLNYIKDINIKKNKNFNGFKEPISCIIQSKQKGNILITTWNGNVYLFTPPKDDFILKEKERERKCNLFYQEEENIIIVGAE